MKLHGVEKVKVDDFTVPGLNHPKQQTIYKRGEKEGASRVEWVEMTFKGDL